jgi:hypothetical protein
VVSFMLRPLYPQGKSPRYSLDRRLGGHQSRSGRSSEEKNSNILLVKYRVLKVRYVMMQCTDMYSYVTYTLVRLGN